MKSFAILFSLLFAVFAWGSCTISSSNNVGLIPQKTIMQTNKAEFSFSETEPFNFKKENGEIDSLIEPSGIISIDGQGKHLLVLDDKSDGENTDNLEIFKPDGSATVKLRIKAADKKPKWEAITRDGEDFYVIGSHAGDTPEKVGKRSLIYRFNLQVGADGKYKINEESKKPLKFDIVESLKTIEVDGRKIYDGQPSPNPETQKAKIEGLSFRTINDKKNLIIGFREPDSLVRVYSAEIPNELTEPVKLTLKPYFRFNAGKTSENKQFKLSSIEYISEMKGFIVLTSSETTAADGITPIFHGNAMWFISDEKLENSPNENGFRSVEALKITEFQKDYKAEGICALPSSDSNKFKFAIVYDNDTADQSDKAKFVAKLQTVELTKNN